MINDYGFGVVGINAPDYNTAKEIFENYFKNREDFINMINEKVYTVRVQDGRTTVITPDGKVATAKCHPEDEFDIVEGFKVAMKKIEEANRKLTQKEKDILNSIITLGGTSVHRYDDNYLIIDFDSNDVYMSIDKKDFKWLKEYEDYDVKELLEKYA